MLSKQGNLQIIVWVGRNIGDKWLNLVEEYNMIIVNERNVQCMY